MTDKKDMKDLTDASVKAVDDAASAVGDAAVGVVDTIAETVESVSVDHEHHPKKAGMPQLDPTWFASQLFWLFVCFIVLYVFMVRGIIPRIREVLETRQHRVDADIEFARSMQEEAETTKQDYEASLEASRNQVRDLVNQAQLNAEGYAETGHKEMDAEIAGLTANAESEIAAQLKQLEKDASPVVKELSALLVEKIMLKKPDEKKLDAIVKDKLSKFSLKAST